MSPEETYVGQWVVYRPHPAAPAEDGEVVGISRVRPELVMVRYRGDLHSKSTHVRDLEPTTPASADGSAR